MILLDTNIAIYLAQGALDATIIASDDIAFATISHVEALGYHRLVVAEQSRLVSIFKNAEDIDLSAKVVNIAIELRQSKNMGLGDAIVAASAIEAGLVLWTANTKDFEHIENLKLHNPMKGLL
jgi:predicted nucleic acid-binding protein